MKSVILHPYDHLAARGCCRLLNPRQAAITAAIYSLNISILVILLYSWRISVNVKKYDALEDVYYGVQIAYLAIIGTQLFMIVLSVVLLLGICRISTEISFLAIPGSILTSFGVTSVLTIVIISSWEPLLLITIDRAKHVYTVKPLIKDKS